VSYYHPNSTIFTGFREAFRSIKISSTMLVWLQASKAQVAEGIWDPVIMKLKIIGTSLGREQYRQHVGLRDGFG
jgi:hypothetical protein